MLEILINIWNFITSQWWGWLIGFFIFSLEEVKYGLYTKIINSIRKIISSKYRFYRKFKENTIIFNVAATSTNGIMQANNQFISPTYLMGMGDAFALVNLLKLFSFLKATPEINASPRNPDPQDFRLKNNIICIGGPASNPISELLINKLNKKKFVWKTPYSNYNINSKTFGSNQEGDLGILLRSRNPFNEESDILIIAGLGDYGTAAASEFAQGEKIKEVYKSMKKSKDKAVVALIRGRVCFNKDGTWKLDGVDTLNITSL